MSYLEAFAIDNVGQSLAQLVAEMTVKDPVRLFGSFPGIAETWSFNKVYTSQGDSTGEFLGMILNAQGTPVRITEHRYTCVEFDGDPTMLHNSHPIFTQDYNDASMPAARRGMTVGCWVRHDDLTGAQCLLGKWSAGTSRNWLLFKHADDYYRLAVSTTGSDTPGVISPTIAANEWHFVCGRFRSGQGLGICVNGFWSYYADTFTALNNSTVLLSIGGRQELDDYFLLGRMVWPFLYNSALTDYEVRAIMSATDPR